MPSRRNHVFAQSGQRITNIGAANKKLLLAANNYPNITRARERLGMQGAASNAVYERLAEQYNAWVDTDNARVDRVNARLEGEYGRENARSSTRKAANRDARLQEIIARNAAHFQRVQGIRQARPRPLEVAIVVQTRREFARERGVWIPWHPENQYETFFCGEGEIERTVAEFVQSFYPYDDSGDWVDVDQYNWTVMRNRPNVNVMNIPMRRACAVKLEFLKFFDGIDPVAYENSNSECVIKSLAKHWGKKERWEKEFRSMMGQASMAVHHKQWKASDGITTAMLHHYCSEKNISMLAFDQRDRLIKKHTCKTTNEDVDDNPAAKKGTGKGYKAIIYYCAVGHMYLVSEHDAKMSLTRMFAENDGVHRVLSTGGSATAKAKQDEIQYINISDVCCDAESIEDEFQAIMDLPENSHIICDESNLLEHLQHYVATYNKMPRIKMSGLRKVSQISFDKKVMYAQHTINHLVIQKACKAAEIPFTHQSFGTMLITTLKKYFKSKREFIAPEVKAELLEKQNDQCKGCGEVAGEKCQVDHIRPLSNGGDNSSKNLQVLCVSCHRAKTMQEHNSCDHIQVDDYRSYYSINTFKMIKSKFFKKVQFCEYLNGVPNNYVDLGYKLLSVDMNKCRRNIWLHSKFNYCVYCPLDKVVKFDGEVKDGWYYVESDNHLPLRKNGFYSRPMIEYCLQEKIISHKNIKYQWLPSFTIPWTYFQGFVQYLLNLFAGDPDNQKLAINSMIGLFGRVRGSYFESSVCAADNLQDYEHACTSFDRPFETSLSEEYKLITNEKETEQLDNCYPIYAQILDIEALQLHKTIQRVERRGAIPVCVKTDAVVYLASKPVDLSGYYWDDEQKVPQYKDEEGKMAAREIKFDIHKPFRPNYCKYNTVTDDETMDFNLDIAQKIVDSGKGCYLGGGAGCGKTQTVKTIKELLNNPAGILCLAPTNVAAANIDGQTIHRFVNQYLANAKSGMKKLKSVRYIFIDEISMVQSKFYSVLLSVKFANPHIKFIISGDFHQLLPVADKKPFRQSDYENSPALHELVDGQRVLLTKCRRADDAVYNICKAIREKKEVDVSMITGKEWFGYKHLSFTNNKRKAVNARCMERFLKERPTYPTVEMEPLKYDKNTQKVNICREMPVISRINIRKEEVLNNEVFTVAWVNNEKQEILVKNESKEMTVSFADFRKQFMVAFCITVHKSQGQTYNERYCIHEYERFDRRLKYVAISRTTALDNINIIPEKKS
jgi:hypothetical protein